MTVILAAGAPPTHDIPLRMFRDADRLIACDGAWRTAISLGRVPDIVVGDGDSIGPDGRAELARRNIPIAALSEQDTNDLCKAFRYAVDSFPDENDVSILGATGLREDHSIGNIFHLVDFAEALRCRRTGDAHAKIAMATDHGVFEPVLPPGGSWESAPDHPVSVFAPQPGTEMTSEGLRWPLDGVAFDSLWRGTLNRTVGGSFAIRTNHTAILYRPYVAC